MVQGTFFFCNFFFLYLQCFALNSFGTSCPSQHWDTKISPWVGRWLLGEL